MTERRADLEIEPTLARYVVPGDVILVEDASTGQPWTQVIVSVEQGEEITLHGLVAKAGPLSDGFCTMRRWVMRPTEPVPVVVTW